MKLFMPLIFLFYWAINIVACTKSSPPINASPENYIITAGIKHQINHSFFQTRSDGSFYFEMDSSDVSGFNCIFFYCSSAAKMSVGEFPSSSLPYGGFLLRDSLLMQGFYTEVSDSAVGSLTITDISNGFVSGFFNGQLFYHYPFANGNYTLAFSGVFKNDKLTKQ